MSKRHRLLKRDRYYWAKTWDRLVRPDPVRGRLGGYFSPGYRRAMRTIIREHQFLEDLFRGLDMRLHEL